MDISNLINLFSNLNTTKENNVPNEIKEQYPYGEFPIRYTKTGQETIRKQSENRFTYNDNNLEEKEQNNFDISTILPIIQLMSGKNKQADIMKIISNLLFKNNPEMQKLFSILPKTKNQEIKQKVPFPDTNKIKINSLKRVE